MMYLRAERTGPRESRQSDILIKIITDVCEPPPLPHRAGLPPSCSFSQSDCKYHQNGSLFCVYLAAVAFLILLFLTRILFLGHVILRYTRAHTLAHTHTRSFVQTVLTALVLRTKGERTRRRSATSAGRAALSGRDLRTLQNCRGQRLIPLLLGPPPGR